jgi:hypothetical protein
MNNNNNSSSKGKTKLDRAEVARDPNLEIWNDSIKIQIRNDSIKIQNDLNKKLEQTQKHKN